MADPENAAADEQIEAPPDRAAALADKAPKRDRDLSSLLASFDPDPEDGDKNAAKETTAGAKADEPGDEPEDKLAPAKIEAAGLKGQAPANDEPKFALGDNKTPSNDPDAKEKDAPADEAQASTKEPPTAAHTAAHRDDERPGQDQRVQQPTIQATAAGIFAAALVNAFRRDPEPQRQEPEVGAQATQQKGNGPSAQTTEGAPAEAPRAAQADVAQQSQAASTPAAATGEQSAPNSARALLDRFEATRMQPRRDAEQLQAVQRAGDAAVNAFDALEKADSTAILGRIREAAQAAPGGMKAVLAEMKSGGAYEDLRKEFDAVLSRDTHFSAAHEKAASALDAYGEQRDKAAPILQNGNASIMARLEALDQQLARSSADVPGKDAGKSVLDETLEKGREALTQAVEAIKSVFTRQSPSAGPSFSR